MRYVEKACRSSAFRWGMLGIIVYGVAAVAVFGSVLSKYSGLIAPDSMPFFPFPWRTLQLEGLLSDGSFTPHALYRILLNPLVMHELTFIVDSFVLALAGFYYLRTQGAHPLAAWCGGLALGLSGYTFTLFSAGHRGYFHMFSCAVWSFGLIARGFQTRRLFYFAMVGLVLAWGVPYQPDVLLLVGALAGAYVLWLTWKSSRVHCGDSALSEDGGRRPEDGRRAAAGGVWRTVLTVWPRFGVSMLVLVLAGFGGIRSAVTTQIANREAQISGATSGRESPDVKGRPKTDAERRERWLFATNWSLPPEDVLEFVVPGVFGNDSGQMPYPYWGRLGRPDTSVFQKGRMMPNYRQHTVYLGLIPVLFALFALAVWLSCRTSKARTSPQPLPGLRPLASVCSDVPFWCAVWAVCLILAMGRFTPVYKLFYAIPYMDYIRAPVKFHHLVEVATALLAGLGMDAFLRTDRPELRRKLLGLAVGAAGLMLVWTLVAVVAKPSVIRHITELGMGQVAETLSGYAVHNLVRAAALAALTAGLVFVAIRSKGERVVCWAGVALLALLSLDQAWVARRYVRPIDVEPFYQENAAVKAVKKLAAGQVPTVVNYATQNTWQDWFNSSLTMNGVRNRAPAQEDQAAPYGRLFAGLQSDPVRLWRVLHAQAVIVPRKGIEGLLRSGTLRALMDFELGSGGVRQTAQPGDKTLTLAAVRDAPRMPEFVAAWQGDVPFDKQVEAVVSGRQTVSDAPSPAGETGAVAGEVRVLTARGLPGVLSTRVKVSAKSEGLLVFDERLTGKQNLLIDGKEARLFTADGIWPAAVVPAGEHEVVLRQRKEPAVLMLSSLTALAVLVWGAAVMLSGKRTLAADVAA